jgi:hypothetical protein
MGLHSLLGSEATMDTSKGPHRRIALTSLACIVVGLAGTAWLASGGIKLGTQRPSAIALPSPSLRSTEQACGLEPLYLYGAFDDCASMNPPPRRSCGTSTGMFAAFFSLDGITNHYRLDFNVLRGYQGAGTYSLNGGTEVFVFDYATRTLWQSLAGVLTVTARDGKSGTLDADLGIVGSTNLPAIPLVLGGRWDCA